MKSYNRKKVLKKAVNKRKKGKFKVVKNRPPTKPSKDTPEKGSKNPIHNMPFEEIMERIVRVKSEPTQKGTRRK